MSLDNFIHRIPTVAVSGEGTYGFRTVGDTSYTTGFDVYFHPQNARERLPGCGRMRLRIEDDMSWTPEIETTHRLDEGVARAGVEPAKQWLKSDQRALFFLLHGAASIDLTALMRERVDLELSVRYRESALARVGLRALGPNEPSRGSPDRVEAAKNALSEFEASKGSRISTLNAVLAAIRPFAYAKTGERRDVETLLAEARDAAAGAPPMAM